MISILRLYGSEAMLDAVLPTQLRWIQTLPDPVTPSVAISPSLLSPITPSTKGRIPVSRKRSICSAASSKTLVKANFSTARFLESLGGLSVICVGMPSDTS